MTDTLETYLAEDLTSGKDNKEINEGRDGSSR